MCIRDLGYMVEHVAKLSDLILFLANDVPIVYDLEVG
jgi:hypothetical protein